MKLKEGVLSADVDQNGHVMLMFILLKLRLIIYNTDCIFNKAMFILLEKMDIIKIMIHYVYQSDCRIVCNFEYFHLVLFSPYYTCKQICPVLNSHKVI